MKGDRRVSIGQKKGVIETCPPMPTASGVGRGGSEAPKQSSSRPGWNDYFLKIATEVSTRSTCLRRQTGAVIVREKRILATGYNGAPSGLAHCSEVGCLREDRHIASGERHELCRGLHAEQNAIIQAARHGIDISKSAVFCTHHPCTLCAKMLINAGIKSIYYRAGYPDQLAKDLLNQSGLKVNHLKIPTNKPRTTDYGRRTTDL